MIYLRADGRKAHITKDLPITTGSVGMKVDVSLSEDYDGLASVVTFKAGTVTADVAYVGELVEVPPQVMQRPNTALLIGVYAQSADGRTVIPTVWDSAGIIAPGTLPVDFPQPDPAPSWAAQVQLWAEDAHNTAERLAAEVDGWEAGENERIAAESARDAAETSRARAEATRYSNESTRVTNEASRVLAEQDRQRAEAERASAESSRVAAEASRANAETARADAETGRASAESQRASAEAERKSAESSRAGAESSRRTAESARASAEQSRITAEQARALAEQARDEAESAREDAESDRETEWATLRASAISATSSANTAAAAASATDSAVRQAEQARVAAESSRASAESARQTAEQGRQGTEDARSAAEASRVQAESQRASSELQRASAEQSRASAETARATAEQARATAESSRVAAESSRVTAESERSQEWDDLTQDVQEAIDAATEAAESVFDDVDALYNGIDMLRFDIRTSEIEGGVAQTENAAKAVPVDLTVYGNSTQGGTPTPDAPVAIKSVDAPVLTMVGGKNLFDKSTAVVNNYINSSGNAAYAGGNTRTDFIRISGGEKYTFSYGAALAISNYIAWYTDADQSTVTGNRTDARGLTNVTVTAPSDANYARFSFQTSALDAIQLEHGTEATAYEPYIGVTAPIDLQDHELRSLPDGTQDQLNLTYDRPSKRAGWAWYKASMVQRIGAYDGATLAANTHWTVNSSGFFNVPNWYVSPNLKNLTNAKMQNVRCNMFKAAISTEWLSEYGQVTQVSGIRVYADPATVGSTVDSFKTWLGAQDFEFIGELATPVTIPLNDIELPVIPTKNATVYVTGGSAQPTWHMDYQIDADAELVDVQERVDILEVQNAQLFGNQLTGTLSGTIATAADAYAAPPKSLSVEGASTQAGTPTPDAPVPILSVDELTVILSGWNLFDLSKVNTNVHTVTGTTIKAGGSTAFQDFYSGASMTSTKTYSAAEVENMLYLPAGTYTLKVASASNAIECYYVDPDTRRTGRELVWNVTQKTFTLDKGGYIVLTVRNAGSTVTDLQINVGSTALSYTPFTVGITTVPDLLPEGTSLRSLPDGTRDTLNLAYLKPSTREGWAWYSREVVHRCKELSLAIADMTDVQVSSSLAAPGWEDTGISDGLATASAAFANTKCLCNISNDSRIAAGYQTRNRLVLWPDYGYEYTTAAEWKTAYPNLTFVLDYSLATPVTTTLDPIELPVLPAPNCTVWCDGGSATPTYSMEYVQDTNIVIADLRAALADLATS